MGDTLRNPQGKFNSDALLDASRGATLVGRLNGLMLKERERTQFLAGDRHTVFSILHRAPPGVCAARKLTPDNGQAWPQGRHIEDISYALKFPPKGRTFPSAMPLSMDEKTHQ